MKSIAWAISLLVVAAFAVPSRAADASQAPQYHIQWLLGHKNLDFFEEAAADFKRQVEQRTDGKIAVDIVAESADASPAAPEIAGKVARGEAEMGHSFVDVVSPLDPRLNVFEAPYLFRDYEHMEGVLDGPVGQTMLDDLTAHHLVGLSFTYSGGASGVATIDRPIRKPSDLKGLKVGVYGDAVNAAWLESLGATPVAIGHDLDSIDALAAAGKLDAVVITWRNFQRENLDRRFHYFNLAGSTYLVSVTYVNDKFFAGLPKDYQKLLIDQSREAGRVERAKTIKLNEDSMRGMIAKGVHPVYLSAAEQRAFIAALKPAYQDKLDGLLGKDFIERARSAPDGAPQPLIPDRFAQR